MKKHKKRLFTMIGDTPIIPLTLKIMLTFAVLLLIATFSTNHLNLVLNQREIIKKTNEMLVKELKDIYLFSSNQYNIYEFTGDRYDAIESMATSAKATLVLPNSITLALKRDSTFLFQVSNGATFDFFSDYKVLEKLQTDRLEGVTEGSIRFSGPKGEYFGVYKYQSDWNVYLIRAELYSDMLAATNRNYMYISIVIIILSFFFLVVGLIIIKHILGFLNTFSKQMREMQESQELGLIDLTGAKNDDIAFLGVSFNSLSFTINNLMGIFRKFVTQDLVERAYTERNIRLEGTQMNLAILFSDIRGFTFMTETLGNDIIDLLNVHYDRVIKCIHEQNGIVGSIIGDAVLAVYGTLKQTKNKSLEAIVTAYKIQDETALLRDELLRSRAAIEKTRSLTEAEERVFKAVLIHVGVGIDGGTVFYGNIGSNQRMTNTVIGDNVNSASRLEGLTRIYRLPVIVSEYIKNEVEQETNLFKFIEIDKVQVKGKTEGKKIYYPLDMSRATEKEIEQYSFFSEGLLAYYEGDWTLARSLFRKSDLEVCTEFYERVGRKSVAPEDWEGIWTMTTK